MTLLTIIRDASDELGFSQPSAVIGSQVDEVVKCRRYANKVGRALMKSAAWQALRTEQTFTSVAGEEQTAILPSDFDRFVPETFWNRTDNVLISGPISAVEWQGFKANNYPDTERPKFIHRGNAISVLPTLGAGKSLGFEYVSQNWCESAAGTGQTAWEADTDVGVIDEEMITRGVIFEYLDAEGQPSMRAMRDFMDYVNTVLDNEQAGAGILTAGDIFGGGRHFSGAPAVSGTEDIV